MENIRPATPSDLPELIKLVNAIFISEDKNSVWMEEKFPTFLSEKNLEHLYLQTDGGRPISHAGYYSSSVIVDGALIHVGSIGSVCTHPDYRGHGIASLILDEVEAMARQEGIEVLLVSGERSLYLRRQCIQVGHFTEVTLENIQPDPANRGAEVDLVEYNPDWLTSLEAVYAQEPVRFYRSLDEFGTLLSAGQKTFFNLDCKTYLIRDGEAARAYFSMTIRDGWAEAGEYAGDRRLLNQAFRQVMVKDSLRTLRIPLPSSDPLVPLLQGPCITQKPAKQLGTVKILNATALMDSLRPYFLQHVPPSILNAMQWREQDGQVSLVCGGDRLVFDDPTQLTRLVFGYEESTAMAEPIATFLARHPEAGQFVSRALPVPLPWAGNWNFI
ncbi:MAG TPA: GNAT family N-acetyltransferase [Anaerolineaceae bacterium]